ncbi:MAG: DUF1800 family protein [Acidobacteriota bacterium]
MLENRVRPAQDRRRSNRLAFLAVLFAATTALSLTATATAQGSLSFYAVKPCRVLDSADPNGFFAGQPLLAGQSRPFTPLASCGISTWAESLSLNVTVDKATGTGYVGLMPAGFAGVLATVNFKAGATRANNTVVKVGDFGRLAAIASATAGSLRFIVDVNGYFADATKEGSITAPPVFIPPPGTYTGAQQVGIKTSTADAVIRYTTDGSAPTPTHGTVYTGAVLLVSDTQLQAIAYPQTLPLAPSNATNGQYVFSNAPTLLIATMVPQSTCATQSLGSGSATLVMAANHLSASLRFSYSNLTGALSGAHVHGANTNILFDIDDPPVGSLQADGSLLWTFVAAGGYTATEIANNLLLGTSYINLHTAACPSGEIKGFFQIANGSSSFVPPPAPPAPGSPGWVMGDAVHTPSETEAARFFMQTTFGGTYSEITTLRGVCQVAGNPCAADPLKPYRDWVNAQLSMTRASSATHLYSTTHVLPADDTSNDHMMESFWKQALTSPDQLRQRVAFALSEILVVSDNDGDLYNRSDGLAKYMDLLDTGAFGNFRTLLEDVTKSPAMGAYLDHMSNDREDPESGQNPDENYAREVMQLLSVGLYKLNPDGTLLLDNNGFPQATYNQAVVQGLAKVFTGWTLANQDMTVNWRFYWPDGDPRANWQTPMVQWVDKDTQSETFNQEVHHSPAAKLLLDGTVLPAGHTAQQDLTDTLNLLFNHANTGPFLCRGLIQRLVTSNPSPGYVYRCAQAFADNGSQVRGDMKAVLRSILLDYEARSLEAAGKQGFGKLREPVLRMSAILRSLGLKHPADEIYRIWDLQSVDWLDQNPLRSPTVFNFFGPTYSSPGAIGQAGLYSPEFQILNETTGIAAPNLLRDVVFWGAYNWVTDSALFPKVDWAAFHAPFLPLGTVAKDNLIIDRLNLLLAANAVPADSKGFLLQAAVNMRNNAFYWPYSDAGGCWPTDFPGCAEQEHLQELAWLIAISPEGAVQE